SASGANNGNGVYYGLPTYANAMEHAIYSGTNTTIPIYYGAKVTNTLAPGKYSGEVLYTATVNSSCLFYTVSFNKNAVDATGSMNSQSIPPSTATPLTTNAFERPGYVFLGWSTDQNATTPTYTDGQSVTDIAPGGGSVTLYAVWGRTMQDWATNFGCATLSTNQYLTLYDSRDKNSYVVKKLADNKCWMVQNLRLTNYNLTSADSNVTSNFNMTSPNIVQSGSSGWCQDNNQSCSEKISVYYDEAARTHTQWGRTENYGALYNVYTATAGTMTFNTSSGNASSSICPKGWRLPVGGTNSDFKILDKAWGGTGENRNNANTYSIFTGDYTQSNYGGFDLPGDLYESQRYVGEAGNWITDSFYNSTYPSFGGVYLTAFGQSNLVTTNGGFARQQGLSVRCITQTSNATGYMQDFDNASLSIGETVTLADKRDYSEYTVKKFSDGSVWMTSNLRLGYDKGYTLTSELTNINDNGTYYLPPAGKQGSITSSSTPTSTTTANFGNSSDNQAKVQYAPASSTGSTNPQDTGYYNFYAATLGKSYYGQSGTTSGYIERDICPKGWQLPVNDSSDNHSWYYFYVTLNGTSHANMISASGSSFPYSGNYSGSSLINVDSNSYWWSSTVTNSNNGYSLQVSSNGNILQQSNYAKSFGFSVRCVIDHDGYMQNFNASTLSSGQTVKLKDKRDGNIYAVRKFNSNDDSVWMVQNLRLGYDKGYALTNELTNIQDNDTATYYLPPAGYQGSLTSSSTMTSTTAVSFTSDNDAQAKVQYVVASELGSTNPQNTGYYSFYTATLGKSYSGISGNISGYIEKDICPKGWQLPVNDSGSHKSWYYFYNTLNSGNHSNMINSTKGALSLAGLYNDTTLIVPGTSGRYWSSTAYNANNIYSLYLTPDNTSAQDTDWGYKYRGYAVRCVIK
ncbi:InlB B-repeat-containing protein, partial [Candidatus Saccharibacteria bacterium]|nr:InlB B-repeat-containing protein [Candidatus Saccharibacteria bacterium]